MASNTVLNVAISKVVKAVEEDKNHNYPIALEFYEAGVTGFLTVLKSDDIASERQKDVIRAKCLEYLERAEKLKRFLQGNSDSPVAEVQFFGETTAQLQFRLQKLLQLDELVNFQYIWPLKVRLNDSEVELSPVFCTLKNGITYQWQAEVEVEDPKMTLVFRRFSGEFKENSSVQCQFFTSNDCKSFEKIGGVVGNLKMGEKLTIETEKFESVIAVRFEIAQFESDFELAPLLPALFPKFDFGENSLGKVFYRSVIQEKIRPGNVILLSEDGHKFQCHMEALEHASSIFKSMFKPHTNESQTKTVKIDDLSSGGMEHFLYFVYVGILREDFGDHVTGLLNAAEKYLMEDLKCLCHRYLVENLSSGNAVECLKLGIIFDLEILKSIAAGTIVDNYSNLMSVEFLKLLEESRYFRESIGKFEERASIVPKSKIEDFQKK